MKGRLILGAAVGVLLVGIVVGAAIFWRNSAGRGDEVAAGGKGGDGSPQHTAESVNGESRDPKIQVEQAYLKFWDALRQANESLDPAGLEQVAVGKALSALKEQVHEQKRKNQPVRVRIEHNYEISILGPEDAAVEDRYVNHSVRLAADSRQPIEPDPKLQSHDRYLFRKEGGVWKVVEIVEFRSPS